MTLVHVGSVLASSSFALTLPATVIPGDVIVLGVGAYMGTAAAFPADFIAAYGKTTGGGNWGYDALAWKVAVASDAGRTVTVETGSPYPGYSQFVATVMRGTTIVEVSGETNDACAPETGEITVARRIRRLVFFVSMQNGMSPESLPVPAGYTALIRGNSPGTSWQNSEMCLANADEGPGVLPNVISGWPENPSSGISIALAPDLPKCTAVARSSATAQLSGGTIHVAATVAVRSVVVAGLFRVVPGASAFADQPEPAKDAGSFRYGTIRLPRVVGVGEPQPVGGGTGVTPPPTTGQIWPR